MHKLSYNFFILSSSKFTRIDILFNFDREIRNMFVNSKYIEEKREVNRLFFFTLCQNINVVRDNGSYVSFFLIYSSCS